MQIPNNRMLVLREVAEHMTYRALCPHCQSFSRLLQLSNQLVNSKHIRRPLQHQEMQGKMLPQTLTVQISMLNQIWTQTLQMMHQLTHRALTSKIFLVLQEVCIPRSQQQVLLGQQGRQEQQDSLDSTWIWQDIILSCSVQAEHQACLIGWCQVWLEESQVWERWQESGWKRFIFSCTWIEEWN